MATTRTAGQPGNGLAPAYRMYFVEVSHTQRLSPSFVRITFTGSCLRAFGASGTDQRIKLLLPQPGRPVTDIPSGHRWHAAWQAMASRIRPIMRSYTVRAHRPDTGELDIDFVLHGADGRGGPVSAWALTTRPGDRVALAGPDPAGAGRRWGCAWSPPSTARLLVIAGDETAVPAVASIVEALPADARGVVCVEVPAPDDRQCWTAPDGVEVRWLVRRCAAGSAPHGSLLEPTVAQVLAELGTPAAGTDLAEMDVDTSILWDVPDVSTGQGEFYAWLAGEAGVIKRLRRLMVNDHGVPRTSVAFMGYWRQGHSG
ncbi:MAG: siderophore-interacting protein [Pseudonocardiaceae bacterium]